MTTYLQIVFYIVKKKLIIHNETHEFPAKYLKIPEWIYERMKAEHVGIFEQTGKNEIFMNLIICHSPALTGFDEIDVF